MLNGTGLDGRRTDGVRPPDPCLLTWGETRGSPSSFSHVVHVQYDTGQGSKHYRVALIGAELTSRVVTIWKSRSLDSWPTRSRIPTGERKIVRRPCPSADE